jgi:HAD superfamily hydrolase (TIGR01509 family)
MLRAVLFDFNGVIVNDEPIHMAMFQKVLKEEGIDLSHDDYYAHYLGMDDRGCFAAVCAAHGRKLSSAKLEEMVHRKAKDYEEYIQTHLEFFPGAVHLVAEAKKHYFTGIVSGALREEIQYGLKKAGLDKIPDVVVAQQDVKNGKPHPEGYKLALELLNKKLPKSEKPLLGEECLVIEDSREGIHSAKEAGMRVAAVAHSYSAEELTPEADWVFGKIAEVSLTQINKHF